MSGWSFCWNDLGAFVSLIVDGSAVECLCVFVVARICFSFRESVDGFWNAWKHWGYWNAYLWMLKCLIMKILFDGGSEFPISLVIFVIVSEMPDNNVVNVLVYYIFFFWFGHSGVEFILEFSDLSFCVWLRLEVAPDSFLLLLILVLVSNTDFRFVMKLILLF